MSLFPKSTVPQKKKPLVHQTPSCSMESPQSNPKLEKPEQTGTTLPSSLDDSVPHKSPSPMEQQISKIDEAPPQDPKPEASISLPHDLTEPNLPPELVDSVQHEEQISKIEETEQNPKIDEVPEVSILPPTHNLTRSVLPSEVNDSVAQHGIDAEMVNLDGVKESDLKIESDSFSEEAPTASSSDNNPKSPKPEVTVSAMEEDEGDEEEEDEPVPKKQKQLASLVKEEQVQKTEETKVVTAKKSKSKKKNNNVWVTKSTRKGKKKSKTNTPSSVTVEDQVLITPVARFPDKGDDTPDSEICLSKVYKAEKVEISEDRLSAGSSKGYRMVRATRGAIEGAWYFEIKVVNLGETGHTRLGWSTDKGDLQAPVGYDGNSFGFRDIDGCKIHKALREKYAEEGYKEGDVIGFYINLPDGESFAPKPPHYVFYKGQRYASVPDAKEEPPKVVPGSEVSFFKNGICQGVAFKDILGGRYYPAASMYTLPDQSNCVVKFNFGPDFDFFPEDFGGRAAPKPMCEVPYHGYNGRLENNGSDDMKS